MIYAVIGFVIWMLSFDLTARYDPKAQWIPIVGTMALVVGLLIATWR